MECNCFKKKDCRKTLRFCNNPDQVFKLFVKLQKELGMSVIMVTHNPLQAANADITYRISKGHISLE